METVSVVIDTPAAPVSVVVDRPSEGVSVTTATPEEAATVDQANLTPKISRRHSTIDLIEPLIDLTSGQAGIFEVTIVEQPSQDPISHVECRLSVVAYGEVPFPLTYSIAIFHPPSLTDADGKTRGSIVVTGNAPDIDLVISAVADPDVQNKTLVDTADVTFDGTSFEYKLDFSSATNSMYISL
jgi:hypothetical protein